MAVDAIFDSVSVAPLTVKNWRSRQLFSVFGKPFTITGAGEKVHWHRGTQNDNFFAAPNAAVASDRTFMTRRRRRPMELQLISASTRKKPASSNAPSCWPMS
ncbi:hypothetical protein ACVXG7_20945 [Enterobacter hormaechei]